MERYKKLIHRIVWIFVIRGKIIRRIKTVTEERDYFKSVLKWKEDNTPEDIKYLEKQIDIKNLILYQLRILL